MKCVSLSLSNERRIDKLARRSDTFPLNFPCIFSLSLSLSLSFPFSLFKGQQPIYSTYSGFPDGGIKRFTLKCIVPFMPGARMCKFFVWSMDIE